MYCDMKAGSDFSIVVSPQMVIPFNPVRLQAIIRVCHYISLKNFLYVGVSFVLVKYYLPRFFSH
jgi:hypothetical protein